MWSIADTSLVALCREAEPSTVSAFVADLYEARGEPVERRDHRRIVVGDGDRRTKIAMLHPDDEAPASDLLAWAETVVVLEGDIAADAYEGQVLDIATIGEQLAYAVDRSTARDVIAARFGRGEATTEWPEGEQRGPETRVSWTPGATDTGGDERAEPPAGGPEDPPGESGGASPDASGSGLVSTGNQPRLLLAAILLIALAGTAVVVAAELPSEGQPAIEGTAGPPTATPPPPATHGSPEPASTPTRTQAETAGEPSAVRSRYLPPGIEQSGVSDVDRLLETHESILRNRSYRLSITYREYVAGEMVGRYRETISVENDTRYRVEVAQWGRLQARTPSLVGRDLYVDGSTRYDRSTDWLGGRAETVSREGILDAHVRNLAVLLDIRESAIVYYESGGAAGTTYLSIIAEHPAWITNKTGSAAVRSDGVVSSVRMSYGYSDQLTQFRNLSATHSVRLTDVDSTSVDTPEWVEEGVESSEEQGSDA